MTQEATYIERFKTGETNTDFESIRKEGIRLLQELSGKIWTDYNIHDPGVTILEQLIYSLTELIYLSDYDVKDIISSTGDEIKYKDLALYKPLEIFPSEIITNKDYCKSIFDNIKGIRNIWIYKRKNNDERGLYTFLVDISKTYVGRENEIKESLLKYYNSNRNLCEDINDIEILKREPIDICAVIEVNNNKEAEEILAEIYFECFKLISPRIVLHSYRDLIDLDLSLDEILSGPEITHGFIKDDDLLPATQIISVSKLMKEAYLLDGVKSIVDFYIEKDGEKYKSEYKFLDRTIGGYVKIPEGKTELKISLRRNDRECSINLLEVKRKFFKLVHHYKSLYNTAQDIGDLYKLPEGKYVEFDNYFSIQNHFPAIYGINQYGIPPGATAERKAKAKQLKAYLLLFEQIMVNFLSQLGNIKELLSVNCVSKSTYFTKALTNVPNIHGLLADEWTGDKGTHDAQLKQLIAKYDDYYERRSRILDYILAMYGEKFTLKTFQQFNYYYTPKELTEILCENKTFLLKNLVAINRYKARSFDYTKPSCNSENVAMIKLKSSLLLGLKDFSQISYSDVLANYNFQLINEDVTGRCSDCIHKLKNGNIELDNEYINENFSQISEFPEIQEMDPSLIIDTAKEIDYLKDGLICEAFFRYGITLESYRIGRLKRRGEYTVVFKHPKYENYIYIGDFKNQHQAGIAINCLRKLLVKLNQQSEGMHIVEHVLLRQKNPDYVHGTHITNDGDEIIFTSTSDYFKTEAKHLIHELRDILHNHFHYTIEEAGNGMFNINIWKDDIIILKGNEHFESTEDAENSIEKYTRYFKNLHESNTIHEKIKPFKYSEIPHDFFSSRISVILPSWSARFNNFRFRDYVKETVIWNLPAHIYPDFYWLDIHTLNRFEKLYQSWLELKLTYDYEKTDELSGQIIRFLLENHQEEEL